MRYALPVYLIFGDHRLDINKQKRQNRPRGLKQLIQTSVEKQSNFSEIQYSRESKIVLEEKRKNGHAKNLKKDVLT